VKAAAKAAKAEAKAEQQRKRDEAKAEQERKRDEARAEQDAAKAAAKAEQDRKRDEAKAERARKSLEEQGEEGDDSGKKPKLEGSSPLPPPPPRRASKLPPGWKEATDAHGETRSTTTVVSLVVLNMSCHARIHHRRRCRLRLATAPLRLVRAVQVASRIRQGSILPGAALPQGGLRMQRHSWRFSSSNDSQSFKPSFNILRRRRTRRGLQEKLQC